MQCLDVLPVVRVYTMFGCLGCGKGVMMFGCLTCGRDVYNVQVFDLW